jgi:hypothetical protein
MRRPRKGARASTAAPLTTETFAAASADELQAVRFEVGDLDADAPALTDAQIEFALDAEGSVKGAAAACLESLSRRYAQLANVSTGDLSISYTGSSEALANCAAELRSKIAGNNAAPFAGGISRSDKAARREDADRAQPAFRRRQFDKHRID